MEFPKLIEARRTVRKYSPDTSITKAQIQEMVKAAQEAPSWGNTQTGRYYCIFSEETKGQFRAECLSYGNNASKTEYATLLVTTFVHNRAGFQSDGTPNNDLGNGWGCYDLGLQTENLILKAEELGFSTLIMGLRDEEKIRKMLSISETETIVSVIAIGKPAEEPVRPKRKELSDILKFF